MTETQKTGFPLSWERRGAGFRADGFVIPAQAGIQTVGHLQRFAKKRFTVISVQS
ncbi:hypothetical protein [Neisseria meningitidis]|uniref:hypothetical protein n=1 Tax=Neisseria meningitidis TaxID=487 RepID=UPI0013DEA2D8|nr:hypothetical protein [Neisseria meningitidis]